MALIDELIQSLVDVEENISNLWLVNNSNQDYHDNHIELTLKVRYIIQPKAVENLPEWHFFNRNIRNINAKKKKKKCQ